MVHSLALSSELVLTPIFAVFPILGHCDADRGQYSPLNCGVRQHLNTSVTNHRYTNMALVYVLLLLVIYAGECAYGATDLASTTPPYSAHPKPTPKYIPEPTIASIQGDLREMFEHLENRMIQLSERVDSNSVSRK